MSQKNANVPQYPLHPYCRLIPEIDEQSLRDLTDDIKQFGLREAIVLLDEQVLDGRSRYEACKRSGVKPEFVEFNEVWPAVDEADDEDERNEIALKWIVSRNIHRRHLNPSQKAMFAAKISDLDVGIGKANAAARGRPAKTVKEAAAQVGASPKLTSQAKGVLKKNPEKVADIEAGKVTVSNVVKESKAQQPPKQPVSRFDKAVLEGAFTGKAFRKKAGELSKLVEQCKITVAIVDWLAAKAGILSIENTFAEYKNLDKLVLMRDTENRLASLKNEMDEAFHEIRDVIVFGHKTYPKWIDELKKAAATDEEKGLISAIEEQFTELWALVQSDMKTAKKAQINVVESKTKQISAKDYLKVFDEDVLLAGLEESQPEVEHEDW